MNSLHYLWSILLTAILISCGGNKSSAVYYKAFSHNDEMRGRPLEDALGYGFNCIEVDAYLIDGKFYVAHDLPEDCSQLKTLEELYFNPLFERIRKNGGSVYPHAERPFYLMIDIKRDGDNFYTALKPFLEENKEMFCSVKGGKLTEGPILLFFSGARPMNALPSESSRLAFLDGTFTDLGRGISSTLMPVVSDDFMKSFGWDGRGKISEPELERLRILVGQAHGEGKLIRFWGAPDTEDCMRLQMEEGVDMIGTDDPAVLHRILSGEE